MAARRRHNGIAAGASRGATNGKGSIGRP